MKDLPFIDGGEKFPNECPVCAAPRTLLASYGCGAAYYRVDANGDGQPTDPVLWGGTCPRDLPGERAEPTESDLLRYTKVIGDGVELAPLAERQQTGGVRSTPEDSLVGLLDRALEKAQKTNPAGKEELSKKVVKAIASIIEVAKILAGCLAVLLIIGCGAKLSPGPIMITDPGVPDQPLLGQR